MAQFFSPVRYVAWVVLPLVLGCASASRVPEASRPPAEGDAPATCPGCLQSDRPMGATVSQVSFQTSETSRVNLADGSEHSGRDQHAPEVLARPKIGDSFGSTTELSEYPLAGQSELTVELLVAEVERCNPSLQAAAAAWRAAAQRYPQVVSLEDPMLGAMVSPSGVGAEDGGGWSTQVSQKVPWPGKRALRGCAAAAEADAMQGDMGEVRLRLAEAAREAFYDYYAAKRIGEVNAATSRLLTQFREIAKAKYEAGQATQQDVLQADVELSALESRKTELTRDEQIAIARINTLLHRAAECSLPPPPAKIGAIPILPEIDQLQETAIHSRPDLYALQSRLRAEQANRSLACKEYYPDVNLVAKYDAFMQDKMRPAVGVDFNIPLRNARRSAAVCEAENRIAQRAAEYQDRLDQVHYEVSAARQRAGQSQQVVRLLEEKTLPAAQRSLESAQANYTAGKLDFLRLLDAQRQLNTQHEAYNQAIAESHRRLAELERAVGQPLGGQRSRVAPE